MSWTPSGAVAISWSRPTKTVINRRLLLLLAGAVGAGILIGAWLATVGSIVVTRFRP